VIQDPVDGEISGKYEYRGPDGRWKSIQLADLPGGAVTKVDCPRQGCSATALSASYSTTSAAGSVWMDRARIGFNTEWGDEDVRWTGRGKKGYWPGEPWRDPVVLEERIFHDANPSSWYTVNVTWLPGFVYYPNTQYVDADVYEIDPFFDDYYGFATNYHCSVSCGYLRFYKLTEYGDVEYATAEISNK
jgi:hypothetical protein